MVFACGVIIVVFAFKKLKSRSSMMVQQVKALAFQALVGNKIKQKQTNNNNNKQTKTKQKWLRLCPLRKVKQNNTWTCCGIVISERESAHAYGVESCK